MSSQEQILQNQLTFRDQAALHIAAGMYSAVDVGFWSSEKVEQELIDRITRVAYKGADALIEERKKYVKSRYGTRK
jgi:hypothetical protein